MHRIYPGHVAKLTIVLWIDAQAELFDLISCHECRFHTDQTSLSVWAGASFHHIFNNIIRTMYHLHIDKVYFLNVPVIGRGSWFSLLGIVTFTPCNYELHTGCQLLLKDVVRKNGRSHSNEFNYPHPAVTYYYHYDHSCRDEGPYIINALSSKSSDMRGMNALKLMKHQENTGNDLVSLPGIPGKWQTIQHNAYIDNHLAYKYFSGLLLQSK